MSADRNGHEGYEWWVVHFVLRPSYRALRNYNRQRELWNIGEMEEGYKITPCANLLNRTVTFIHHIVSMSAPLLDLLLLSFLYLLLFPHAVCICATTVRSLLANLQLQRN